MRIAIPTRFQQKHVLLFIALVFAGQELEGTNIVFALLTAVFIGLWAVAFNLAGGLEYPSGGFVLANGLFSVVLGLSAKVLLFEPGQRNMMDPIRTMFCYTLGMLMMLVVCFLVRVLRPPRALISPPASLEQMKYASIVCLVVVILQTAVSGVSINASGSLLSAIRQISGFGSMVIVLATTYEIKRTNGRRSVNWVTAFSIGFGIFYGLVYFGKTSILAGFLTWAVTASVQGYNFKKKTVIGLSLAGVFMVYYLVPYSQYVRFLGSKTGSLRENIPIAIEYLSDLNNTRNLYLESQAGADINDGPHLYDQSEGFLDRLVIVAVDDDLIHYTGEGNVFGLSPTFASIANLVPHFIWKDKPLVNAGNTYGHELDLLAEDDDSTGIAISITADAYHQATWLGILVLEPLVLFVCFIIFDSLAGSARYSVFALVPILDLFNAGVTGGIGLPIGMSTYGVISLLAVVGVTNKLTPFLMNVISGKASQPDQAMPDRLAAPRPTIP